MNTILFLWTVVATQAKGSVAPTHQIHDWRPMGVFASPADCQRAAAELALKTGQFRCIQTGSTK